MKHELDRTIDILTLLTNKIVDVKDKADQLISLTDYQELMSRLDLLSAGFDTFGGSTNDQSSGGASTVDPPNAGPAKPFYDISVSLANQQRYIQYSGDSYVAGRQATVNAVCRQTFKFYEAFTFEGYPFTAFIWFNDSKTHFIQLGLDNYTLPEKYMQVNVSDINFTSFIIYELNNGDFSNYQTYKTIGGGIYPIANNFAKLNIPLNSNNTFAVKDMDDFQFTAQFVN